MSAMIALQLLLVPVLIAINAFFVAAEYAVVTIRGTRVEELRREGVAVARILARLKENLPGALATIQICITATNLLIGAVAESALTSLVVLALSPLKVVLPVAVARAIGLLIGLLIVTFFTVVLSELLPKALTLQYTDKVALWVARPVAFFGIACAPLARLMNKTADLTARLLGLGRVKIQEAVPTEAELEILVDKADQAGEFHDEHGRMLRRAFDFADLNVRHVMIPLQTAGVAPSNLTISELALMLRDRPFTRWALRDPVTGRINGVINVKMALFALAQEAGEAVILHDLAVEPTYLDPDLPLLDALAEMRRLRRHLCVVRDQGGGDLGIVALQDVLSAVVGRIPSETTRPAANPAAPPGTSPTKPPNG